MPAAWEIKQSKSVLVGILHTDLTTVAWSLGLRNLIIPGDILPVAGMPYDHAELVLLKAHEFARLKGERDVVASLNPHNQDFRESRSCLAAFLRSHRSITTRKRKSSTGILVSSGKVGTSTLLERMGVHGLNGCEGTETAKQSVVSGGRKSPPVIADLECW